MKTTAAAIISCAAAAMAAPAPRAAPSTFYGLSVASGSSIQYDSINANGEGFWLNKPTSSYCPTAEVSDCPAGNETSFSQSTDQLHLNVEVPGGQQVYVAADGHLAFTIAHSAAIPAGASVTGFGLSGVNLQHNGSDFLACAQADTPTVYQVYAASSAASPANCTGFAFYTTAASDVSAWQYV